MADGDQQVAMLGESHVSHAQCINENGEMITVEQTHVVDNGEVGEDILQQALDEATEGYDNTDVEYTTEENIAVVADSGGTLSDANGVTYSYVTAVPAESQTLATACQAQPGQSLIRISPGTQVAGVNQVVALQRPTDTNNVDTIAVTTQQQQLEQEPQVVQVVRQQPGVVHQVMAPAQGVQTSVIEGISTQGLPQIQQTHVQLSQTDSGTPGSITVLTNTGAGGEPLGSSGNPIRIIQQGNKYTSVQQLTPEQVAQIMQVVQQQQLAQTTTQGGGSSVLFNPQTQTRIVYRVIYPSELHSKNTGTPGTIVTGTSSKLVQPKTITVPKQMLTLGTQRRPYRKRIKEEDDKVDGPELTREEKETKKKHRPRTRSGRVSRPPKHMVQDYKHIHHLDWEEDQDDSDGGYSDYKVSDEESSKRDSSRESALLDSSMNASKPKKFKCDKCEKAYIGAAGLARHYRLNPDHGNPETVLPTMATRTLDGSFNGIDGSFADDSSTQDSISSTTSLPMTTSSLPIIVSPTRTSTPRTEAAGLGDSPPDAPTDIGVSPAPAPATSNSTAAKTTLPRGALRAKQHYIQENTPTRRKGRLKELVRQCTDEELMEVVLPRLSRVITTWEFLLMKVERGRPSRPHITDVTTEYESLTKQVEKMCADYLHPIAEGSEGIERHSNILQMTNPAIAQALGLNVGKYSVRDVPKRDESTFQYKLLTTDPGNMNTHHPHVSSNKRTVQLVTPDQLVTESPAKKARLNEPCITSVTQSSGVVTVSMANGVLTEGSSGAQVEGAAVETNASAFNSLGQPVEDTVAASQDGEHMNTACVHIVSEKADIEGANGETQMVLSAAETMECVAITAGAALVSESKEEQSEPISSLVGGRQEVSVGSNIETKEHVFSEAMQVTDEGIGVGQTTIAVSDYEGVNGVPNTVQVSVETTDSMADHLPPDQSTSEQLEHVIEVQQEAVTEIVPQHADLESSEGETKLHPVGLSVDQVGGDLSGGGDTQAQVILPHPQPQERVVSKDGQTVLFTSDGGQTFYHQPATDIEHTQGEHQVSVEASHQIVSMETPEGLVEGQLVTNEDGTQFIIPHQETTEQAVYQTPEGLIVIQNPDGTLRILSNGDSQIPLETVQALLAIDGEGGQIQVEGSMEQTT